MAIERKAIIKIITLLRNLQHEVNSIMTKQKMDQITNWL